MARFATDRRLLHGRVIGIRCGIVILLDARVVARRAHRIPIHAPSGPMSPFSWLAIFVSKHIEPFVRSWIVGGLLHLPATARKGDQKLPQRVFANDAGDRARFHLVREADTRDLCLSFDPLQGGLLRAVLQFARRVEGRAVKFLLNQPLRLRVVGPGPHLISVRVAFATTRRSGKSRSVRRRVGRRSDRSSFATAQRQSDCQQNQQGAKPLPHMVASVRGWLTLFSGKLIAHRGKQRVSVLAMKA